MRSYNLTIIDKRSDDEIKEQVKSFKDDLLQLIDEMRELDEDTIIKFIEDNRVTSKGDIEYHKQQIRNKVEIFGLFSKKVSWETHQRAMIQYSKLHPKLIFKLKSKGDEYYDIWIKYFKAGKIQICQSKIVIDNYDEDKLTFLD